MRLDTARAVAACPTCPSRAAVASEVSRLGAARAVAVPRDDPVLAPSRYHIRIALARQALTGAHTLLLYSQLVVVVDRNPAV
jgi:hypothetical protein